MWASVAEVSKYLDLLDAGWSLHLAPRAANAPTVISTFAGCGGSSLGYSMAGFRELLAVEWDDNAVATFKLNFPDVPVYHGDIAGLSVEECLDLAGLQPGELDVFDGSPPCQGFSTAGKRVIDDPRNNLFKEFVRLLRGLQPKVFVMENVSGMVKGKMKLVFAEILRELKGCGYRVSARLMNAMYFNVPQSRERMIFIGVRSDMPAQQTYPSAIQLWTVGEAIGDLPEDQDESFHHIWIDEEERQTQTWRLAKAAPQGSRYGLFGSIKRHSWNKPTGTIQRSFIGAPYLRNSGCHPLYTRTYSVREMARLCSFPDLFQWVGRWEPIARLGNVVPPFFMRAIAEHIRDTILVGAQPQLTAVAD